MNRNDSYKQSRVNFFLIQENTAVTDKNSDENTENLSLNELQHEILYMSKFNLTKKNSL